MSNSNGKRQGQSPKCGNNVEIVTWQPWGKVKEGFEHRAGEDEHDTRDTKTGTHNIGV